MGQGMKNKLSEKVLRRLELTRLRQKAWREIPEVMERARRKATAKAAAKRHANHAALIARLSDLPATLTTDKLRTFIAAKYRGEPKSFFNRLRRHGLMAYDPVADAWVNHCHVFPVG